MECLVSIAWTTTAKRGLSNLPKKVQRGLIEKIDELSGSDPRAGNKPLIGPLQGCYRIVYSRYRAVYRVEEEKLANGKTLVHLKILFIAVGIRKDRDKKDVYKLAEKLIRLALPEAENEPPEVQDKKHLKKKRGPKRQ